CKPEQIPLKCVEDVQVFIGEPEFIHRSDPPEKMALKAGSKLGVAEGRGEGLDILDARRPGCTPFHSLAEAMGKIQDPLVQQKTCWTEIASGEAGERLARLNVGVVGKAREISVVTQPD